MFFIKKLKDPGHSEKEEVEGAYNEELSIERILAAGICRGLSKSDSESMTLGMWIDYIIEYNNMVYESKKQEQGRFNSKGEMVEYRKATQADFNAF